jgi:hypothetical protein
VEKSLFIEAPPLLKYLKRWAGLEKDSLLGFFPVSFASPALEANGELIHFQGVRAILSSSCGFFQRKLRGWRSLYGLKYHLLVLQEGEARTIPKAPKLYLSRRFSLRQGEPGSC